MSDWNARIRAELEEYGITIGGGENIRADIPDADFLELVRQRLLWHKADQAAREALRAQEIEEAGSGERFLGPVDLSDLMKGEAPQEEWLLEPVLPRGRLNGINGNRGDGKSLLLLDLCCRLATGQEVLLQEAGEPVHIVYIDMEMSSADLYERLADLGYTPDHPLFDVLVTHLHYFQMVDLPPLNTAEGGVVLERLAIDYTAGLVVLDTLSRVVKGDENASEVYRDMFTHTLVRLKRREITTLWLDHFGKDKKAGARGSSAKGDVLDVEWKLTVTGDVGRSTITLTRTKGRQSWIPDKVTIHRRDEAGILTHDMDAALAPNWVVEVAQELDTAGVPADASLNVTQAELRRMGKGRRRDSLMQVVKFRRGRARNSSRGGSQIAEPPGTTPGTTVGTTGNRSEPEPEKLPLNRENVEENSGNHPGNHPEPVGGVGSLYMREPPPTRPPRSDFQEPDEVPF